MAGDVVGGVGGEEHDRAIEVFGALYMAHGRSLANSVPDRRRRGGVHRSEHVAWADAVDVDVEAPPFDGYGFCHVDNARL